MSRRKQSNPKPIKLDEEEEDDEELEEEVEHNHCNLEGRESGDVLDDEDVETSPKFKSSTQGNAYECPVCSKGLDTQHDFTVHIRMHNSEEHTTTHTCSLCSKTLSSASSLDRHMLVHSGERPFKCSRCNMAFTTNGNMHRHMRTHHGESSSTSSNNRNMEDEPRVRTPTKRPAASPRPDDESIVPAKKISGVDDEKSMINEENEIGQRETNGTGEVDEQLHCPVCSKGFLCKYGLQTHLETHPDYVFKCHECNVTFRNYRGLNRHQYVAHVKRNGVNSKSSAIKQAQNTTLVGFQDLTFLDFSSTKFAVVAKAFCEKNARRPSSAFHIFECPQCKKAFPCGSALKMHLKSHSNHLVNHRQCEGVECLQVPFADKENFLAVLGLQANTTSTKDERLVEEPYENPTYFTHGMPCMKNRSGPSCSTPTSDGEDFADIQSILSLTTSPALLSNMNGSVNSVSASSASPRRGLAVNPESPATADSATASPKMPSDVSEQAATSTSHSMNSVQRGRFPCKLCPLVFPNLRALKGHNRSHLGMSPYRCNMCSYTSIDKSTLLRHLRTHNGERPFMCRLCQYAFTTKANCERHMRKRHGKHNKQEIRSAMEQKPQSHDPENTLNSFHCPDTVCKYCNVDFKFYRILRHHLRSLHSSCARKPFQCRQCHMGFSTKNNCYRHVQKQHTEVKDNVEESIWCCYADTVVGPGKEGRDDEDGDAEDERSGNENEKDGMQSPSLSVSPGPPLLDPIIPISDTPLSDMEMSSVEALVSWSTRSMADVPLQEEPLDLAVHPVDLTLKKSTGLSKDISPPCLPKINQSSIHIPSTSSSYPNLPRPPGIRVQSSPFIGRSVCNAYSCHNPLSAPDLSPGSTISSSPSSLCSIDINSPYSQSKASKSTCSSPVAANLSKQGSSSSGGLMKKQKQKRYRTERPFKCDHCDAGFTLRSNMERHIKQQHPDQWMLRSRGRKPSLSASSTSRPLLPRTNHESSLLRPISNQVKEAISQQIRQRLAINAASTSDDKGQSSAVQTKKESNNEVQEHAQDLVSVSRLLDTATAQNIQEIFRQAETNKETNQRRNEESKGEVKRSAYTNAPHRVSCPFCARRFPWTSSLRRHILTHTGQKPFKCQYCPLLFTTKSNCDRHLVRKHGGVAGDPDNRTAPERPYRCVLCPNSAFSTPSNLRKHMQQKHEQEDGKMWDEMMENDDGNHDDDDENENGLREDEEEEEEEDDDDNDEDDEEYGDNDDDEDEDGDNVDAERCKSKAESVNEKTSDEANDEDNVPSMNQDEVSEEEENKK